MDSNANNNAKARRKRKNRNDPGLDDEGVDVMPDDSPEGRRDELHALQSTDVTFSMDESLPQNEKVFRPSRHDYSRLLSMLYAIALIVLGLLFPLTEALREEWNSSLYNLLFQMFIFTVAIVFIAYLQIWLIPRSQRINSDTALALVRQLVVGGANSPNNYEMTSFSDRHTHVKSQNGGGRNAAGGTSMNESDSGETYKDVSSFGSAFSHEGSSLYLRFGALIFSIGNIIYIGLLIENGSQATYDPNCNVLDYWWISIFRLVFLLAQSFLIFKNIHVKIDTNQPLARFGFMHLIATNMCVWLQTIINEILDEYLELNEVATHNASMVISSSMAPHEDVTPPFTVQLAGNITNFFANNITHLLDKLVDLNHTLPTGHNEGMSGGHNEAGEVDDCDIYRGVMRLASPYLFPFVLEYSLIAMGTVTVMYSSIVHSPSNGVMRSVHNWISVEALNESAPWSLHLMASKNDPHLQQGHQGNSILAKSHRGLYCGVLVLSSSIVSIFTFYFVAGQQELIYLTTDLILHLFLLVATLTALFCLNKMAYIAKPLSVDDVLLIVSMCGCFFFELAIIMSSIGYMRKHSLGLEYSIEALSFTASLVALIQTFLQVLLIISGMRRYPNKMELVRDMPGRGTVTFLIIVNVAVWFVRSLHAKQISHNTEDEFYGLLAAILQTNINLPLLLFFRFHSSICCADIWIVAYTPIHRDHHHSERDGTTSRFPTGNLRSLEAAVPRDRDLDRCQSLERAENVADSPRTFRKKMLPRSRSGSNEIVNRPLQNTLL